MPLIVGAVVLLIIIAAVAGSGGNGDDAAPAAPASTSSAAEQQEQQAAPPPARATPPRSAPAPRVKTSQEKARDCTIRARYEFERQIRDQLNDPDSMKTRGTRYGITVYARNEVRFELDYTARNRLGGTERATATGMMNIDTCAVRPLSYAD